MSLTEMFSMMGSAAYEAAALAWMELAMFLAAGLLYLMFAGNAPFAQGLKKMLEGSSTRTKRAKVADDEDKGDYHAILEKFNQEKFMHDVTKINLPSVVDAMRKLGKSAIEIVSEIRSAIGSNAALLSCIEGLLAALLRDDATDLLIPLVALLEENGRALDASTHASVMSALLRRRDFAGVKTVASNLSAEQVTPKMRGMMAFAAAQLARLDEALGHLRQMPGPAEDKRSALSPVAAAHILSLAAKESRVPSATEELVRLRVRLEAKHFDDLLAINLRSRGDASNRRELLDAAVTLQVPKSLGMYQALAALHAHDADGNGLRALVQELEGDRASEAPKVTIAEGLALVLLEACRAVKSGELASRVLDLHRSACAGAPGSKVIASTCAALLWCERPAVACDFYEREMVPKGIWPDMPMTSALMKAAAHVGRSSLAQRLADHASNQAARSSWSGNGSAGANGDLQRQATMIKAYARERNIAGAKAVFDKLVENETQLTPLIWNCMLDAYVQCGDIDAALRHFQDMKERNYADVVGYNTMLKAYLGRGRTEDARALVDEMTDRGLQPSKVTYNELLHSKVLAKDRRGTWAVLDEMKAAGVRANSVTCSILLKSLSMQSQPEDVRRIMELIEDVEEAIDEVLFSSVIEGCIRIKQLDLLSDLMRKYRERGSFANLTAPTYGSMIKAYGQAGDIARVRELWSEMEERGVKPTAITLGCMTEALVTNSQADEAFQLLHTQLGTEDRKACINTVIYSTVLKGFATAKRIDKVFSVYKEMRTNSIPCNTITYNTMLDACAKSCAMDRASSLLVDMKESSVEPDIITYSTIVKGYCVEGDVDRAFVVLKEMVSDDKFAPDEIMYNSILDGCAKQHRVDDAMRVLDEMKSSGIGPSNYTLSILVKLLGHARRLGQAFRMVEDLSKQNGFRPNVQVYTCLVQACILNRRLEKALALHDTMVADAGCKVDEKFYAVLARGCLQMHQPLKAAEVVRAAYQLPGHSLAEPAKKPHYAIGVEYKALEEIAARLNAAGHEEQEALTKLNAELYQYHGISMGDGSGAGGRRVGRGGGGGGGGRKGGGRY